LICFEQPSPDDRAEVSRPGREPTYPGRNPVRHVTDVPAMVLEQLLDANAVGRERVIGTAAKLKPKLSAGAVSSRPETLVACAPHPKQKKTSTP
jgi:hypothetical protein